MRILYDDQGFFEHHGGVSRYFTEMMKRLPTGFEYELPLVSTSNCYLRQAPFNLPPLTRSLDDFVRQWGRGYFCPLLSRVYWWCAKWLPWFTCGERANARSVAAALAKGDFDVFHMTGPHWVRDDWKIVAGKKPIVVTVHDLVPDMLLGKRRVVACRSSVLRAATHVIAVSESTRRDLARMYGVPDERMTVIHHGYLSSQDADVRAEPPVDGPYLLYVGKRDGYKNFSWFVTAVAPVLKAHPGLRLFCTGEPFRKGELGLFDRLGIRDAVLQGFVPDSQMTALFAGAKAFVYPSLYEGFGIPILDAFAAGCPVVLSNCGSFPEVAGDAALYFDKDDDMTLRAHLEELIVGSSVRAAVVSKGFERLKLFSWQKCAQETAQVYAKVCAPDKLLRYSSACPTGLERFM